MGGHNPPPVFAHPMSLIGYREGGPLGKNIPKLERIWGLSYPTGDGVISPEPTQQLLSFAGGSFHHMDPRGTFLTTLRSNKNLDVIGVLPGQEPFGGGE